MAPISTSSNKAWRLASGITLLVLGLLVVVFGAVQARLDFYGMAVAALNTITGLGMILFYHL